MFQFGSGPVQKAIELRFAGVIEAAEAKLVEKHKVLEDELRVGIEQLRAKTTVEKDKALDNIVDSVLNRKPL